MLKVRITFVDDERGNQELQQALDKIEKDFDVISTSEVYKGRGKSKYSNVYLDLENKK